MWEKIVKINGPYNFDRALERLSLDPLQAVDPLSRTVKIPIYDKQPGVAVITATGTTEKPEFRIQGGNADIAQMVEKRIFHLFQWDTDIAGISQHFTGTALEPLFKEHRGTPFVLDFSPYACLIKCIIHQQLNMKFAHTLTERFVYNFGFQKDGVWFYPSPEKTAALQVTDLRALQFSERKAEYVIGLSKLVASGELDLVALEKKPDEEILKTLVKIRGIGPWTVQNFLMFGLGRLNHFPKADIGIQKALKKLFQLEKKPTYKEMDAYAKDWEPYLSYASLYLWRSIE
ncbi:DNA-3-methyladenine glycosylase [Heyndrickxia faecalis]|uniref:DNA-3-methyladenine glycosylase family protein n=1 Tax=Heyndrickxia TaxID=2837504 RepID=UPI000CE293AE|nr:MULTISPECIES: DNA-3-methyladenine glycosylase [Heyndrickxia]AVD57183.1 DNA-3-methyladenine glycosylase [Heyndrickxia coagulans]MED4865868.1 DNA-3-methyladenine glycosylase [Weizmannia sp. CD-2023]